MMPKMSGIKLTIDGRIVCVRNINVSLINKPDVIPTNFNASYNDENVPVTFVFIFHWRSLMRSR
jgi:hypothetical protein